MWAPLVRATPYRPVFPGRPRVVLSRFAPARKPATSLSAVLATLMLFETVAALAMPFAPVRVWATPCVVVPAPAMRFAGAPAPVLLVAPVLALAMPVAAVTGTVMLAAAALALDARFVQEAVTVSLCR